MAVSDLKLAQPITLPCGLTLPNRLVKAAMTEQMADKDYLPSADMHRVYAAWGEGGWGMVLTGNLEVNTTYLGGPADTAVNARVPEARLLESWRDWVRSSGASAPLVVQLNHPGRQSPYGAGSHGFFEKTVAPSAVPLRLGDGVLPAVTRALVFGTPRAMTAAEIRETVAQFARAARLAADAGFAGVEVHAAHGYLLAQFLSSASNRRTDEYGGSPANEARIVVEVVRAIREATPKGFCVGIKLNSVDHQSPGALADCMVQLEEIRKAGVDFLEISGGSYEDPTVSSSVFPSYFFSFFGEWLLIKHVPTDVPRHGRSGHDDGQAGQVQRAGGLLPRVRARRPRQVPRHPARGDGRLPHPARHGGRAGGGRVRDGRRRPARGAEPGAAQGRHLQRRGRGRGRQGARSEDRGAVDCEAVRRPRCRCWR